MLTGNGPSHGHATQKLVIPMAPRHLKNLFFTGELHKIQVDTGGYNLQAVFSTGHLAGKAAAQLLKGLPGLPLLK